MANNTAVPASRKRPEYRNIHVTQIVSYRLPAAGIVSILHRISGALMFLLLPFVIWMFDTSLTSEISYDRFTSVFIAGVRHLWMDATHAVTKGFGASSATFTLVASVVLTLALGAKLFGLF